MELLGGCLLALVDVDEIPQGIEVVFRGEELAPLDAEDFRDAKGFVGDPLVELQKLVQVVGRKKIPIDDFAPEFGLLRMVGDEAFLDGGIHAAVHASDPLHEAHGVPVQVVVDQPGGILEVQALGKNIR